jgi:hypothetical protein
MKWFLVLILLFSPFSLFAVEGGFGESMGLDFYTQIDRGHYAVRKQLIEKRLTEYVWLDDFIKSCATQIELQDNAPLDIAILQSVRSGIYTDLTKLFLKYDATSSVDTSRFVNLINCINSKYDTLNESVEKQIQDTYTIASIGIYTDGTTSNSDYDIISDINAINDILFSEKITYNGTKNIGRLSLLDLLSGNAPKLPTIAKLESKKTGTGANADEKEEEISDEEESPSFNLGQSLAAWWCSTDPEAIPFSNPDAALLSEIAAVMQYGNISWASRGVGWAYGNKTQSGVSLSRTNTWEKNDHFHTPECDGVFCVKFKMIPGNMKLLGGWNTESIESILNERYKEINEISQYDLTSQIMTQGFIQNPRPNFQFWKSIWGLKTFIYEKPQLTQNLKKEERKEDVEARRWRCAAMVAGLDSSDRVQLNAFPGMGYTNKWGANTATVDPRGVVTQVDADILKAWALCLEQEVTQARVGYYQSFSTELTEIQAFTDAFLTQIVSAMNQIPIIEKKPTQQD